MLPAGVRVQAGTRLVTQLTLADDARERMVETKVTEKQRAVLGALAAAKRPLQPQELAQAARCTLAPIAVLRRKGLIRASTGRIERPRLDASAGVKREPNLRLNSDQQLALDAILAVAPRATASHDPPPRRHRQRQDRSLYPSDSRGRRLRAAGHRAGAGNQSHAADRRTFPPRFGEVAVLHSHLSDAERHWHWQRIAEGQAPVVVGARSAIFAPTPNLGLIVLDEEHEGSFKQATAPRYHARDVAIARAAAEDVPLVLGSATPSLESWSRRQARRISRWSRCRGACWTAPCRWWARSTCAATCGAGHSRGAISRPLHQAISAALEDDGQVILLLNRRGFSTHIQCPACGQVMRCPDCDIALTHHRTHEIALCHYCDYEVPAPTACPACDFSGIRYSGQGTQRLEAEVRARFPGVPCLRMDTDTMRGHGSHERALADFRAGKAKILLGTQMIAKGLDFPNVTLVGVINADTALHLPDFRAAERTFHLVTQVAGRTGRGPKGGRVLVQTFSPDHPAIRAAVRHDFAAFAAGELPLRKCSATPPLPQ